MEPESFQVLPQAHELRASNVVHFRSIGSTMDEAHARAQRGAPAGTLIVADEQTAGRGRGGNVWESQSGQGVWFTLIERPSNASAIDVMSLRLGLAVAKSVEHLAHAKIRLKWPNDVFVGSGKLAGILVEARWREGALDWVAIGIGLNLRVPPTNSGAAALRPGTERNDVLRALIPAIREAAQQRGILSEEEVSDWAQRDLAVGRLVAGPVKGIVRGVERSGVLRIEDEHGVNHVVRAGSLLFA